VFPLLDKQHRTSRRVSGSNNNPGSRGGAAMRRDPATFLEMN